jgi:hypothetical protein
MIKKMPVINPENFFNLEFCGSRNDTAWKRISKKANIGAVTKV